MNRLAANKTSLTQTMCDMRQGICAKATNICSVTVETNRATDQAAARPSVRLFIQHAISKIVIVVFKRNDL